MAEVAVTVGRPDLRSHHPRLRSSFSTTLRGPRSDGEARPAGAAVVLVGGREQGLAGDDVDVDAGLFVVPELVAKRRLGPRFSGDSVLLGRQVRRYRLGSLLYVLLMFPPSPCTASPALGFGPADRARPGRRVLLDETPWLSGVRYTLTTF